MKGEVEQENEKADCICTGLRGGAFRCRGGFAGEAEVVDGEPLLVGGWFLVSGF